MPARSSVIESSTVATPALDVRHPRGEQRGRAAVDELPRRHREIFASETAVAADLDGEREGLVSHGRAGSSHRANAGVGGRRTGQAHRMDRHLEPPQRIEDRGTREVLGGAIEASVGEHHD